MRFFSDTKTSLAFGQANQILGKQVISLVVISASPEKIPLNPLQSFCKLIWDPKETEGIGREVLEDRVNQSAFTCLIEGGPFPTSKFLVEVIYNVVPKGTRGFGAKRKPKISRRQGPYATTQDAGNFPLPLQRSIEEEDRALV